MSYEQTIHEVKEAEKALHAKAAKGEVPQSLADAYSRAVARRDDFG